jgi:hypothetical protein
VQRAPGIPHALIFQGREINTSLGRMAPRELYACLHAVIASAAKQSRLLFTFLLSDGLLRRFAPRNDGMVCLTIESVGRFFARSRNALNCHHPRRRVIQYSGTSAMEPHRRSVLDTPHARGMTSVGGDASVQNAARAYCFLRRAVAAAATSACSPSRHRKISTASTG